MDGNTPTAVIARRLRSEAGRPLLTQDALAQAAGLRRNAIGNYLRGHRTPDAVALVAWSSLGIDVLWVLTGRRETRLVPCSAESCRLFTAAQAFCATANSLGVCGTPSKEPSNAPA